MYKQKQDEFHDDDDDDEDDGGGGSDHDGDGDIVTVYRICAPFGYRSQVQLYCSATNITMRNVCADLNGCK